MLRLCFLERACKMDSGTPRSASYTAPLGCLPWEGDSVVRDTSEGKRTTADQGWRKDFSEDEICSAAGAETGDCRGGSKLYKAQADRKRLQVQKASEEYVER